MTSAEVVGSRPSRRVRARLLVPLDGTAASSAELARALRDAVRQEGSVLACAVVGARADDVERALIRAALETQVAEVVEAIGVQGHTEIALLDEAVFEALCDVGRGGALVVVQENRRTVLRSAPPREPVRPIVRHA
ncbi:hypothetical protein [Modestobacter caceresii]|uniref:hypothetical protein n=1 Tax=Modestobacter caceresii TaxID=1522368 RepID=UPI0012E0043A|nr:hypothetical protein [Modestobacter caceresii]